MHLEVDNSSEELTIHLFTDINLFCIAKDSEFEMSRGHAVSQN